MADETEGTETVDPGLLDIFSDVERPAVTSENQATEGSGGVENQAVEEGNQLDGSADATPGPQADAATTTPEESQAQDVPTGDVTPPPAPEPQPISETDYKAQVEDLRKQLVELMRQQNPTQAAPEQQGQVQQTAPAAQPAAQTPPLAVVHGAVNGPETREFVSQDEYDKIFESKDALNAILQRVYEAGVNRSTQFAVENVYRSIPQVVNPIIAQQMAVHQMAADFYRANPDLVPYKDVVAPIATRLAGENPSWAVPVLFENVAKTVRQRLHLRTVEKKPAAGRKPGLPNAVTQGRQTGLGPAQPAPTLSEELGGIFD